MYTHIYLLLLLLFIIKIGRYFLWNCIIFENINVITSIALALLEKSTGSQAKL